MHRSLYLACTDREATTTMTMMMMGWIYMALFSAPEAPDIEPFTHSLAHTTPTVLLGSPMWSHSPLFIGQQAVAPEPPQNKL